MSDEIKAYCSTKFSRQGGESFRLTMDESTIYIETPTIFNRTYWTHEQARALRDALNTLLDSNKKAFTQKRK